MNDVCHLIVASQRTTTPWATIVYKIEVLIEVSAGSLASWSPVVYYVTLKRMETIHE